MRLINTTTLTLELFPGDVPFDYAILSHTWEKEEVTYDAMQDLEAARTKAGFPKIEKACQVSREAGLDYVWVDTCCINKSSSSELSEAINSMYRWYRNSKLCFALLSDLDPRAKTKEYWLSRCRWFTRGWTLQELIAPTDVVFLDRDWTRRGSKLDLVDDINSITGIDHDILKDAEGLPLVSLARRMSWAANRKTTRIEDQAYSLLGVFDVNMPMLYGEGHKAFKRLQEAILTSTTDLSVFAWQAQSASLYEGLLARSPDEFAHCRTVLQTRSQFQFQGEITLTNKGIKISPTLGHYQDGMYVMDLHCHHTDANGKPKPIGIYLSHKMDAYYRYRAHILFTRFEAISDEPFSGSNEAFSRTIYLAASRNSRQLSLMQVSPNTRRIKFKFPAFVRIRDVHAVPSAFCPSRAQFQYDDFDHFFGFVRFAIEGVADTNKKDSEHERCLPTAPIIVVVKVDKDLKARSGLFASSDFTEVERERGLINPLDEVDRLGPLGEPRTLSMVTRKGLQREIQRIDVSFLNGRVESYVVWPQVIPARGRSTIEVNLTRIKEGSNTVAGRAWTWLDDMAKTENDQIPSAVKDIIAKERELVKLSRRVTEKVPHR
ncbi:Vegetative incompatibility protein HET-E-1 [Zalerion maritima]|uniref:Vegetative incompatibility protein HET-E-1 n=1 Tax=Zalerion maritima TaxID=339359 RepID=A0AAD5WSK5_9PEZI|nr:Vegetative incompatibility protein HET-E-1 [Zalerion maritima]